MRYPEMVKTNARYRGPMESAKQSGQALDIGHSIEILKAEFADRAANIRSLMGKVIEEYDNAIPLTTKQVMNQVKTMKGGEL
jgi:hypothetical protein